MYDLEDVTPACDYCACIATVFFSDPLIYLCSHHARELAERGTLTMELDGPHMVDMTPVAAFLMDMVRVKCPLCSELCPVEDDGNILWHLATTHDGHPFTEALRATGRG